MLEEVPYRLVAAVVVVVVIVVVVPVIVVHSKQIKKNKKVQRGRVRTVISVLKILEYP